MKYLCGLAEGVTISEPVDGELRKSSAKHVERKVLTFAGLNTMGGEKRSEHFGSLEFFP